QAEAQSVAKERCIESNRKEVTGSLSMYGDVKIAAGVSITCEGFGQFSGNHFVNKVTHRVDRSGYVMSVELGMPKGEKSKAQKRKQTRQSGGSDSTSGLYYEGDAHY
ncbi:MAG: hypothetical protein IJP54_06600, partial [Synergistaceae bacterium]|nr:hypothetical protein [Synergistaceae bacterium]